MPPELLGPTGLLVGALLVIGALWREHLKADQDDRTQRDTATAGWRDQTTATTKLTDEIAADRREREKEQKAIEDALRRLANPQ